MLEDRAKLLSCQKGGLCGGGGQEEVHRLFMRSTMITGKQTPIRGLMSEEQRVPTALEWRNRMYAFWNRLTRADGTFKSWALHDNISLCLQGHDSWSSRIRCLCWKTVLSSLAVRKVAYAVMVVKKRFIGCS